MAKDISELASEILKVLDGVEVNDAQSVLGSVLVHICLEEGCPKLFAMVSFARQWEDVEKKLTPSKTQH